LTSLQAHCLRGKNFWRWNQSWADRYHGETMALCGCVRHQVESHVLESMTHEAWPEKLKTYCHFRRTMTQAQIAWL
jgi:hypothetical protein